ncbi:hypothetical protein AGMMS50249_6190 [candidate division SR1 bacterium]|nr:hypothetical protein AGMMS50249_6190 [candidate division SR1 bacterium]
MKHHLFLLSLMSVLFLAACGPTAQPQTNIVIDNNVNTRTSEYSYAVAMQKPDISQVSNRESVFSGFYQDWSEDHIITQDEFDHFTEYCDENERDKPSISTFNGEFSKEISRTDIKVGNSINLTGYYEADALLNLTDNQKIQIASRGWTILPIDILRNNSLIDYSKDAATYGGDREERAQTSKKIGGQSEDNARYPFNTILITDDLLLHIYHKLFDNSLKSYEEKVARDTLANLSKKLYNQYVNLSKKEQKAEIKQLYDFLAAYRSVPLILLPSEDEIGSAISKSVESSQNRDKPDLTDEEIKVIIDERIKTYTDNLFPSYQNLIPEVITKILDANEARAEDRFLMTLGADFFKQADMKITQDYTQFKPRSHYTDSSLLKTYFIATKRLMREKFYFNSPELTRAAMLMASTITDNDLKEFNNYSEQIKFLIGMDDDLNLSALKSFLKSNSLSSANQILAADMDTVLPQIKAIHPQKITSAHYETDEVGQTNEDEAKSTLDGFVFFGEKFTLDSYIFDQMTAGSAEKEYTFKPNMQTALIIPDILANSDIAHQFAQLWLTIKSNTTPPQVIERGADFTQVSSYDSLKLEVQNVVTKLVQDSPDVVKNVYHTRLSMLSDLLDNPLENAPYFRIDPTYQIKSLITYLGSYTELKHDTLLYVKQSYAEMGGGGPDSCNINIDIPALPVPKGYIESEPDFLDKLISLTDQTSVYFSDDSIQGDKAKLEEFSKSLKKLKTMSIQQMNNKIITDEDFEWLRTDLLDLFLNITIPIKTFGEPTNAEMRSAIIADIFTSEADGPLYEAIGRPALMILNVDDINGTRTVIGPVFTHYEFYQSDNILTDHDSSRYSDLDRQDQLWKENPPEYADIKAISTTSTAGYSLPQKDLFSRTTIVN